MRVAIVTPVFNDWISLSCLIEALEVVELPGNIQFSLLVIDDGSSEPATIACSLQTLRRTREIEIIGLACNLGHQRAIAVGLVEVSSRGGFDAILVMDSDIHVPMSGLWSHMGALDTGLQTGQPRIGGVATLSLIARLST